MLRFVVILLALSFHVSEQAPNSSITTHPSNTTSHEGQNATLVCVVTGNPTPTVQWYKDGLLLNNISANPRLTQDPGSNSLIITNLTRNDEGFYACNATNNVSSVTSNQAYLTVYFKPKILINPLPKIRNERQDVTLSCRYEGKPVTDAEWYRNNTRLDGSSDSRITISRSGNASLTESSLTMANLSRKDEGRYKCQVNNVVGGTAASQEAQLTVNYAPVIFAPPLALTTNETNSVTFSCLMEGKPQPNVTWTKNGTDVDVDGDNRITTSHPWSYGNSTATMTIRNVNRSDEGWYICVAYNGVGAAVISESAKLTVNYPPRIFSISPQNETKHENHSMTFNCTLEGKPLANVTWMFNNTDIVPDGKKYHVSGTTSVEKGTASLTITDLHRSDQGNYTCRAQNKIGTATSQVAAFLKVLFGVDIFVNPQPKSKNEEDSVTFTCEVEGKPAPNVTWLVNDNPLTLETSRMNVTQPTTHDRTVVYLTINDLKRTDEGSYSCNVKNSYGEKNSNAAALTVNYPPKILVPPTNKTVVEKSNVSLTCYLEGKPLSNVTWLKDGHPIIAANGNRISVSPPSSVSNTSASISITNVSRTDEGYYSCQALNDVGNDTSSGALLTVNYGVTIFVNPQAKSKIEGESVTFTCEVEGKPASNVTWLVNDNPLTLETSRMNVTQPATHDRTVVYLTINALKRTDEGSYNCRVNNFLDERTSTPAFLAVYYPPVIFQNPLNLTKREGDSMVMLCGVDGNPVPEVTWKKDVVTLVHDGRINITKPSGVGRVHSTLTISNLVVGDKGTYKCVVNNTLNAVVSFPGSLIIVSLDLWFVNPETNFTVTEGQSATLVCEVWGESPDITWYRDGKSMEATRIRTITSGKRTEAELTFNNVQAENSGVYTCTASNSLRSISTQMTLVVSVPIEVDMDITVENMEFSAELNNKSSPRFQNLSNTFKKEISTIYKDMEGFKEVQVLGFSNGSVQVVFRVRFEIKVNKPIEKPPTDVRQKVANTAIEEISKTNGFIGTLKFKPGSLTPLVPPPPPRNLTKTEVKLEQISITWNKPEYHQTYGVTGYEVQYKEFAGEEWNNIPVQGKDVNDYVINDLKQETKYLMKIVAVNKRGNGPPSNQLEVSTDKQNIWTKIWTEYKWVIVAVGIVLFLLVLTGIFLCCRRRRRQKNKVKRQQSVRRKQGNFSISGQSIKNSGFEMAQLASKFREIPREQIMIGKELGSGQFGLVTRGYLKQDRMHCTIKMLKESAPHSHYRDLLNELDIMSSIEEHPNIVNLIGACTQGGPVWLVVELAEYGSLLDFLHNNQMYSISHREKVSILTESQKIRISRDVARGLEHLAGYRCVHRDLAARNVLLGTNMTAKLSDFGLARDVYERGYYQQLSDMKKLPVRWMSIEAIETMVATKESDIWSFGVLMWEIYTGGKLPFLGLSAKEVLKKLKKGTRLSQPIDCSDEIYAIMMSCWHSSPLKRPSIDLLATVLDRQLQLRRNDENNVDSSMA